MPSARAEYLLKLARLHEKSGMPVPIDLEAALAAEGLSLEPLHSCKESEDNG